MKEEMIEIYDVLIKDKQLIIFLIEKDSKYILEKCIIFDNKIELIYKEQFNNLEKAFDNFNKLKAK